MRINSRSGSIFLVAIWSLCFLGVLAVLVGSSMRQKLMLVNRLQVRQGLRPVAEAGILRAISCLLKDSDSDYDSFLSPWADDAARLKDIRTPAGYYRLSCVNFDDLAGKSILRFGLIDEERKINVNTSDLRTLENLFKIVLGLTDTQAQELAASVIDWRDADSMLSIPLGSAEDSDYRNSERAYEAKDAPIESFEELLLIKGVDRGILESLRNYITVFGSGKVNLNTASKAVLLALGLEEATTDKIITYRAGEDRLQFTSDDRSFVSSGSLSEQLSKIVQLSEAEAARLSALAENVLTTRSSCFSATSTAYLFNPAQERLKKTGAGRREYRVRATFNRKGKILEWKEE